MNKRLIYFVLLYFSIISGCIAAGNIWISTACEPGSYIYSTLSNGEKQCTYCDRGYYSDTYDATECISCVGGNNALASNCMTTFTDQISCIEYGEIGAKNYNECARTYVVRHIQNETGEFMVYDYGTRTDTIIIRCNTGYVPTDPLSNEIIITEDTYTIGFGVHEYNFSDPAYFANAHKFCRHRSAVNIPDGVICGGLFEELGIGSSICTNCSLFIPEVLYSDGAREWFSDCYALTSPGNYYTYNPETYELIESQCPSGDYCPGGIKVRGFYDESIGDNNFNDTGNFACNALPGVHTVSPENATSAPGSTKATDCYVDMSSGGETGTFTDESGTYISGSSGGMCYYTE